jgi:hypothetical protein
MEVLPSIDMSPFVIFLDPEGRSADHPNLDEALRAARRLQEVGHHIRAIKNETTIFEGAALRSMLGEPPKRPSLFPVHSF